jgi:hypothetical protein
LPSRFRLATPRPILWALSHALRRCDSAVHSGLARPLNHPGRFRAPWPPSSCARLPRPSDIPALPQGPSGYSGSAGLSRTFRSVPVQSLSASRLPEQWREPHYSAFDRYRRCNSPACSGLHATPEPFGLVQCPLAAYHLRQAPIASTRVNFAFRRTTPPSRKVGFHLTAPGLE